MLSKLVEQSLQFEYHDGKPPDDARPGMTTGWRTLPFLLIAHAVSGETTVERKDRPPATIKKGDIVLIQAGLAHRITIGGTRRAWGMWCHVNYSIMGTVDVMSLIGMPDVISGPTAGILAAVCRELVDLHNPCERHELWVATRVKELGFTLLKHILEVAAYHTDPADFLLRSRGLEPVLAHIRHHLADPLTIHDLAGIACRSRSGFHQYFKAVMGKSPKDFIRDLRIRSAQVLLTGSDLAIAEIGQRVGYPDPFHFSRVFKDVCGLSPKRFRLEQSRGLWSKEQRGAHL